MLNNAWPEMVWHLYDYYLNAGGAFYGTRKALEPLHAMFSYDDNSVWCVSSQFTPAHNLELVANVFDAKGTQVYTQSSDVFDIPADGSMVSWG